VLQRLVEVHRHLQEEVPHGQVFAEQSRRLVAENDTKEISLSATSPSATSPSGISPSAISPSETSPSKTSPSATSPSATSNYFHDFLLPISVKI
jgi:hypothetical protein